MVILPLKPRLARYLKSRELIRQFEKQKRLFENNPFHPGLNTEILEPKHLRIYSFRITKNFRAIFVYNDNQTIEVVDINNHYR